MYNILTYIFEKDCRKYFLKLNTMQYTLIFGRPNTTSYLENTHDGWLRDIVYRFKFKEILYNLYDLHSVQNLAFQNSIKTNW